MEQIEISQESRQERVFAYQRSIESCRANDTIQQVIDDLENIIRLPNLYE